jgi:hypothetical protein
MMLLHFQRQMLDLQWELQVLKLQKVLVISSLLNFFSMLDASAIVITDDNFASIVKGF